MLKPLLHPQWSDIPHGFFNRCGGVSTGIYQSLNCGLGSDDNAEAVEENLDRVRLYCQVDSVQTLRQIHSTRVITVDGKHGRPEADGLVTTQAGLAIGVLSADCAPILFADLEAGVVGAAHAGWKGALAGVAHKTVEAMCALGAKRQYISAVVGPAIAQNSYEVSTGFRQNFLQSKIAYADYFVQGVDNDHWQFDLQGFLLDQLRGLSLGSVTGMTTDTYPEDADYFSFRRTTHLSESDYGRQISVIALPKY